MRRLLGLRRELSALAFAEWSVCSPFHSAGNGAASGPALLLTRNEAGGRTLVLVLNPEATSARFPLPRAPGGAPWRQLFDSSAEADLTTAPSEARLQFAAETSELQVQPKSIRILLA